MELSRVQSIKDTRRKKKLYDDTHPRKNKSMNEVCTVQFGTVKWCFNHTSTTSTV